MEQKEEETMEKLAKSDFRKIDFRAEVYTKGFRDEVIDLHLYQLDILKLIKMAERCNNSYFVRIFKRFLMEIDKVHKDDEKTDFDRQLPRINLKELEQWEKQELYSKI